MKRRIVFYQTLLYLYLFSAITTQSLDSYQQQDFFEFEQKDTRNLLTAKFDYCENIITPISFDTGSSLTKITCLLYEDSTLIYGGYSTSELLLTNNTQSFLIAQKESSGQILWQKEIGLQKNISNTNFNIKDCAKKDGFIYLATEGYISVFETNANQVTAQYEIRNMSQGAPNFYIQMTEITYFEVTKNNTLIYAYRGVDPNDNSLYVDIVILFNIVGTQITYPRSYQTDDVHSDYSLYKAYKYIQDQDVIYISGLKMLDTGIGTQLTISSLDLSQITTNYNIDFIQSAQDTTKVITAIDVYVKNIDNSDTTIAACISPKNTNYQWQSGYSILLQQSLTPSTISSLDIDITIYDLSCQHLVLVNDKTIMTMFLSKVGNNIQQTIQKIQYDGTQFKLRGSWSTKILDTQHEYLFRQAIVTSQDPIFYSSFPMSGTKYGITYFNLVNKPMNFDLMYLTNSTSVILDVQYAVYSYSPTSLVSLGDSGSLFSGFLQYSNIYTIDLRQQKRQNFNLLLGTADTRNTSSFSNSLVADSYILYPPFIEKQIYLVSENIVPTIVLFNYNMHPSMTKLSGCIQDITYVEIHIKDNLVALSEYIQINRDLSNLAIDTRIVELITVGSSFTNLQLEFQTKDIFGRSSATYSFILTIRKLLDKPACSFDTIKLQYIEDQAYLLGDFKSTVYLKYSNKMPECKGEVKVFLSQIVDGMQQDYDTSVIKLNSKDGQLYIECTDKNSIGQYTYRIDILIPGQSSSRKFQQFTVTILEKAPNCWYSTFLAPQILNTVQYVNLTNYSYQWAEYYYTSAMYNQFTFDNTTCTQLVTVEEELQLISPIDSDLSKYSQCFRNSPSYRLFYVYQYFCQIISDNVEIKFRYVGRAKILINGIQTVIKTNYTDFSVLISSTNYYCAYQYILPPEGIAQSMYKKLYYDIKTSKSRTQLIGQFRNIWSYYCTIDKYQLYYNDDQDLPDFINTTTDQFSNHYLIVNLQNKTLASSYIGNYKLTLTASSSTVAVYASIIIDLELYDSSLCKLVPKVGYPKYFNYPNSGVLQNVQFKPFIFAGKNCRYNQIKHELTMKDGLSYPNFMKYYPADYNLTFSTSFLLDIRQYIMVFQATLNPELYSNYSFTLDVTLNVKPNTMPPKFFSQIPDMVMFADYEQELILPRIIEPDGNNIIMQFFTKGNEGFPTFVTNNSDCTKIIFNPKQRHVGFYDLQIKLTDEDENKDLIQDLLKGTNISYPEFIKLSDTYSFNIKVRSSKIYEEDIFNSAQAKITFKITDFSKNGFISLSFSEAVTLSLQEYSQINQKSILIMMRSTVENQNDETINWEVESFSNNKLKLSLKFTSQQILRTNTEKILLQVRIVDPTLIVSPEGYYINPKISIQTKVPTQSNLDEETQAIIEKALSLVKGSVSTFLFGNLALNIILSTSIQMVWGMINTLQIVVLASLFNITFPGNTIYFFQMVSQISSFQIIPTDQFVEYFFDFTETQPINDNFDTMDIFQHYKKNCFQTQLNYVILVQV
eukprot:403365371